MLNYMSLLGMFHYWVVLAYGHIPQLQFLTEFLQFQKGFLNFFCVPPLCNLKGQAA